MQFNCLFENLSLLSLPLSLTVHFECFGFFLIFGETDSGFLDWIEIWEELVVGGCSRPSCVSHFQLTQFTWDWAHDFERVFLSDFWNSFVCACNIFFYTDPTIRCLRKQKNYIICLRVGKRVSEFQKRRNDSHQNMRIQVMSDDDEEVRRTVGTHQHSQPFFLFLFRLHTEPFYIKDFLFSSLALRVFSDVMIKSRNEQDES